jgi:hypothetical protein
VKPADPIQHAPQVTAWIDVSQFADDLIEVLALNCSGSGLNPSKSGGHRFQQPETLLNGFAASAL